MNRTAFQVLVIPFIRPNDDSPKYCVLKRAESTGEYWQFVAGGGEIGETPLETAKRESSEEIGSDIESNFIQLESLSMIPVINIGAYEWGDDISEIPEYCFGVELKSETINLSKEHTDYKWLRYEEAYKILKWGSNKKALQELHNIIKE
jgi:dATP pyrophosphohydrolase